MSWFNSLDSVVRLQQILSWVGVVSAILAAVCGVLAYYLNNQARTLHVRQVEERMTEETQDVPQDDQGDQPESVGEEQAEGESEEGGLEEASPKAGGQIALLEEQIESLRAELRQSEEDARQARTRADQAQEEAAGLRTELDDLRQRAQGLETRAEDAEESAQEARLELQAAQEAEEEQFLKALRDKPSGPVDIVAVQGLEGSRETAAHLQSLLERAGWDQVQVREAQFEGTPEGIYFVVHSQQTMPEYAAPLAIGLAIVDLMPMPARVKANPGKSPGYLGIVIGAR
ncbi:MAG TPA: hypothetical protein VLV83_20295 [Acidobacteriota bacterium]|nr:hypothetical protein [Acidobacteriota bacterium]